MTALRGLGVVLPDPPTDESLITDLCGMISSLDENRVALIARVLNQAENFNEVVREQLRGMDIGNRYEMITRAFNSIRGDAREMVKQVEDGRIGGQVQEAALRAAYGPTIRAHSVKRLVVAV
jgi:hypothetical protein